MKKKLLAGAVMLCGLIGVGIIFCAEFIVK